MGANDGVERDHQRRELVVVHSRDPRVEDQALIQLTAANQSSAARGSFPRMNRADFSAGEMSGVIGSPPRCSPSCHEYSRRKQVSATWTVLRRLGATTSHRRQVHHLRPMAIPVTLASVTAPWRAPWSSGRLAHLRKRVVDAEVRGVGRSAAVAQFRPPGVLRNS